MKKASQQTRAPSAIVFYSYAHEDETLREELEKHLSALQRQGLIEGWHDRLIMPGTDWEEEISTHLDRAQVILLLISADFLASDYCYGREMALALERDRKHQCHVIPILLRAVDWQEAPFAHLQSLPRKKAVNEYDNQDVAFREIAKGIREIIEHLNLPSRPTVTVNRKHRQHLLRRVRNFWIENVLDGSLHHAAVITLGLQEQPDAIANPWHMVMQESNRPAYPLPQGTKITHVFDEANGQLLILGEPGAGKTMLLLELARDLLDRAEYDELQPLPVVFHLSSWAQKRQPFSVWLAKELETKYEVPRKIAETWVDADQILPLLDGFDEVAEDRRTSCITAINAYRSTHLLTSMVICSRKDEYVAQAARLALRDAVFIQPLTQEQIDKYLMSAGSQLEAVRTALRMDTGLRKLATTPLWLSVLTLAYQGISVEELVGVSLEKQRHLIFEKYVERMLARRAEASWTPEEIRRWLAWLARQMKQHHLTDFSLASITADWFTTLPMRLAQTAGSPITALIAGYGLGLSTGLTAGVAIGGAIGEAVGGDDGKELGEVIGGIVTGTGAFLIAIAMGIKGGEELTKRILWKAGVGPKNYIDFLDYAADHILLRKVGEGSYIFVHQLLLDYFASLDIPSTSNDTSSPTN